MRDFEHKVKADALVAPSAGAMAIDLSSAAPNLGLTLDQIKALYARVDIAKAKSDALARIKVRIWEEGDLVNGIDLRHHPNPTLREQIVRNLDAGGNIYLVYIDGRLVYNQWHIRNEGVSPIPDARLQEIVDDHVTDIAQGLLSGAIKQQIIDSL